MSEVPKPLLTDVSDQINNGIYAFLGGIDHALYLWRDNPDDINKHRREQLGNLAQQLHTKAQEAFDWQEKARGPAELAGTKEAVKQYNLALGEIYSASENFRTWPKELLHVNAAPDMQQAIGVLMEASKKFRGAMETLSKSCGDEGKRGSCFSVGGR